MKIKIFGVLALLILALLSLSLASCGGDSQNSGDSSLNNAGNNQGNAGNNGGVDLTGISTQDIISVDGVYKIKVQNAVCNYDLAADFLPKIKFNEGVHCQFSSKKDFSDELKTSIELKEGDNFIYLKVSDDNGHKSEYTFNVYRNKMFTVTFDPNGGQMDKTEYTVEEGTTISKPGIARVGYTINWTHDFSAPINSNITIVASWIPNKYVISATVDGVKNDYEVTYGEVPSVLPKPSKAGYNFVGWKEGSADFNASVNYEIARNIEIVASFEAISYNIQYILGYDGVVNAERNPASFNIETPDIELLSPTFDDKHTFLGWYTDPNFSEASKVTKITSSMAGSSVTLYAKWNTISSVSFDANGGDCDKDQMSISFNEEYTLPTPTLKNYVFDGWYNGESRINNTGVWSISGDVELVAKWLPRQNSIEYVLGYDGAVNSTSNPTSYDVEDGTVALIAPTFDEKHIFVGWYTDPNFTESSRITEITAENVTEEMILYAKWKTVSTVTFVTNSDAVLDSVNINYGDEYTLPTVTKEKYTFGGWFDEKGKQVYGTGNWTYESDIVLYAKWNATEYSINYVMNGGSFSEARNDKYSVETDFDNLVMPTPSKLYATFDGWYFDSEFTVEFDANMLMNYEGVTLYAKWNAIKVTINYDADGGNVLKDSEVINLGQDYVLLTTEKPGYKFAGWYMGDTLVDSKLCWTDGEVLVLNLKAKWTIEEYTIDYDLDGGTTSAQLVTKYNINSDDIVLPVLTKQGFYFVGWLMEDGKTSGSVVIKKGSTGNRTFKAVWTAQKDAATGLLFSMVDGKMVVVGIERTIDKTIVNGIKIPAYFNGVEVVAIDSYAFKAFGEKFTQTSYANMQSSYVTISVPTTVKKVGAKAFDECNGIKVVLYDPDKTYADHEAWDATVTWEKGNKSARDCIWGFRPAIGWTRYSKVTIPDGYDTVTD